MSDQSITSHKPKNDMQKCQTPKVVFSSAIILTDGRRQGIKFFAQGCEVWLRNAPQLQLFKKGTENLQGCSGFAGVWGLD